MPHLPDQEDNVVTRARDRFKEAWDGFWDFTLRDNVLEVAIGLIIAAAFTKVVNSFVSDLFLPIISLLPFLNRNLEDKFAVLRKGKHYSDWAPDGYNTLEQARDDGALVMAYGAFLNNSISFVGIGLTLYTVGQVYTYFSEDVVIKRTVKCRYCRKWISSKYDASIVLVGWMEGKIKYAANAFRSRGIKFFAKLLEARDSVKLQAYNTMMCFLKTIHESCAKKRALIAW